MGKEIKGDTMKFEEFERLIHIEFIENVLRPYSPSIAHRREYKGQYYQGFEIGVVTDTCKFQFAWEEGGGVMIGSLTNTFTNKKSGWFSLDRILCFLAQQPFVWMSPFDGLPHDEKIVATFRHVQKSFAPYVNETIKMFSSPSRIAEWTQTYNVYEDEQFRLRYPSFYEEYLKRKYS